MAPSRTVPEELIEIPSSINLKQLGVGPVFGSVKQTITELFYSAIDEIPVNVRQDVLAFDWWIHNIDRTLTENGGNPNLLWMPGSHELIVIDHNQAFDEEFSKEDFFNYHVFKDDQHRVFSDQEIRNGYVEKFINALNKWDEICDSLPIEWNFVDYERTVPADFDLNEMYNLLARCKRAGFWG